MKVAIIGSRDIIHPPIEKYLPKDVTEIVSGGATGVDTCAKQFAKANNIKCTEFLPEYHLYGKSAPLKRNLQIIEYSDMVIAFWDGTSRGTKHVINHSKKMGVPCRVVSMERI